MSSKFACELAASASGSSTVDTAAKVVHGPWDHHKEAARQQKREQYTILFSDRTYKDFCLPIVVAKESCHSERREGTHREDFQTCKNVETLPLYCDLSQLLLGFGYKAKRLTQTKPGSRPLVPKGRRLLVWAHGTPSKKRNQKRKPQLSGPKGKKKLS